MRIGIMGSSPEEIDLIFKKMYIHRIVKRAKTLFYIGTLYNHSVVTVQSGIGKVNAAMTAQLLIQQFHVQKVLLTGSAGALLPSLQIGDIVISTRTQQYDVDFTALGFPLGVIPNLKTSIFKAHPQLIQLALQAARCVKGNTILGKILSGDQFIASRTIANFLRKQFNGVCVEAEGAAVGQVCYKNQIPFVIIRGISDQAGKKAPADFEKFVRLASTRAQYVVLHLIKHLHK